jgi:phospholipid/cholesterol/gamma-HCH transport system permease protein
VAGGISGILPFETFYQGLLEDFIPYNVFFALTKSYTYAFIISSIPAYYGYYVEGGSLEIGRAGTKSVIVSCILILLADYALAALLL